METIEPKPFYNRQAELKTLHRHWTAAAKRGAMALLYGRRRLGKTYLLQRFFTSGLSGNERNKPHCYLLAEQTTATVQRQSFAQLLLENFPDEGVNRDDIAVSWNSLFRFLTQNLNLLKLSRKNNSSKKKNVPLSIIIDEFPYLVKQSPELVSIIQAWWDREGSHYPVFVMLCGSQLSTMTALGAESSPLYGRFDAGVHHLQPLSYIDVMQFYKNNEQFQLKDFFTIYGIFGGTPRYHALVKNIVFQRDDGSTMQQNVSIKDAVVNLLLRVNCVLENEVKFLLGSEQIRDPDPYHAVLTTVASGCTSFGAIQANSGTERGVLSFYLDTLIELGWVRRERPFGDESTRRLMYRIADPFLLFWYRVVSPLKSTLQFSDPEQVFDTKIAPYLNDYMGRYIFEEICIDWLKRNAEKKLGLTLRSLGRYWSRDGQLEIDLIGELADGSYLFGECKWSAQRPIGLTIYHELLEKISRIPERKWTKVPTLIIFAIGGHAPQLQHLASSEKLLLVDGAMLSERVK